MEASKRSGKKRPSTELTPDSSSSKSRSLGSNNSYQTPDGCSIAEDGPTRLPQRMLYLSAKRSGRLPRILFGTEPMSSLTSTSTGETISIQGNSIVPKTPEDSNTLPFAIQEGQTLRVTYQVPPALIQQVTYFCDNPRCNTMIISVAKNYCPEGHEIIRKIACNSCLADGFPQTDIGLDITSECDTCSLPLSAKLDSKGCPICTE